MSNITQDDFNAYEKVRESGVTNMFAISVVSDYSGLNKDKIDLQPRTTSFNQSIFAPK